MISLDFRDKRLIYEQVAEKLKEQMAFGIITEHEKLPSVRRLAMELSINPNMIRRAYAELEREGYLYSLKHGDEEQGIFAAQTEKLQMLRMDELKTQLLYLLSKAKQMGMSDEEILSLLQRADGPQKHAAADSALSADGAAETGIRQERGGTAERGSTEYRSAGCKEGSEEA